MALMLATSFIVALNDALGAHLVKSFGVAQVVAVRAIGGILILEPELGVVGKRPAA